MKRKIFYSALLSSLISLLITVSLIFVYAHYISEKDFMPAVTETAVPIIIGLLLTVLISVLVSKIASGIVASDINSVNVEHPKRLKYYPELNPLVDSISLQSYKLSRRINELKMRENEFVSMTLNMSEGMVIINSRASVISINQSAREIFGFDGITASAFSLDRSEAFRDAVTTALSGKTAYYHTQTEGRYYSFIVTPVSHEERIEGAVIIAIDVTEKEEREKLRREFTANVSHELKTPLTSISGFAELILGGVADGDDAKRFAGKIYKEANRLVGLVGDIIRLSELDGGEIPYEGEIDLHSVCLSVAEALSDSAERAGVRLSVSGMPAYVAGNRRILEEMVYNLADNAVKYNKSGGSAEIKVESSEENVFLTVKDDGIGIPKDEEYRVFERFYRVDKSHSKATGGTGLGLSIVKHSAVYHKARIELESEIGKGTEIKIIFEKTKGTRVSDTNNSLNTKENENG